MILEKSGTDVQTSAMNVHAGSESDESPERMSGGGAAHFAASPPKRPMETLTDQEYVRSMEERYGIREEGIL